MLATFMALAVSVPAWADQTVGTAAEGKGSITIQNAAKGEKYKVTKIFDATVTGTADGSIAYLGTIPSGLEAYFEYIVDGSDNQVVDPVSSKPYVKIKDDVDEEALFNKLKELYGDASDGTACTDSPMIFQGLDYGYYVIASTQGEAAITVDSTNPDVTVYDKNTTTPTASKTVDDKDVYIGETVTYTLEFNTTNWLGTGKDAKQVVKYEIKDTLPSYLSDVNVTSIKVDADGDTTTTDDQTSLTTTQFSNKKIDVAWADEVAGSDPKEYTSKYPNGAKIIITYTAKVTAEAIAGEADGNRNVVELTPYVDNDTDEPEPWSETFRDDETIKTYGAAFHKVDEKGNVLTGAKFAIKGLTVTGSNGQYTVSNYDSSAEAENGTEMEVDDEGYIYILGLPSDITLTLTETVAPKGYNKLTAPVPLTPIKMSETTTFTTKTIYYDPEGKVIYEQVDGGTSHEVTANNKDLKGHANDLKIENQKGTELPETGGMGTRILYTIGGIMLVGGAVALVSKKRVANMEK